ncbi:MAG: VOC family protein [Pyrinomonadaceae bacterium]
MQVMTQLAFNGQCRQAFEQYEEVLGGKITVMNTFGGNDAELPPGSVEAAPEQIRFAEIQIGDYAILGNDLTEEDFKPMQGFNVALHVKDVAEAERIFDGLAEGGQITTPLTKVAWSPAFGLVTDRFDVPWLILALGE